MSFKIITNSILSKLGLRIIKIDKNEVSARDHIHNFVVDHKELFTGNILDIGTGNWNILRELYSNQATIKTFDIEPSPYVDVVGDAEKLSKYFPEKFDVICAFELLEHTKDPQKIIDEVYKLLKDGGVFISATPFFYQLHGEDYGDYWRFTRQGLKLLMKDFSKVDIVWTGLELKPAHYIAVAKK